MAFHPYPQVIAPVFNLGAFGPPQGLTPASTCSRIDHPASGLGHATKRLLKLAFATDPPHGLTSLHTTNSQTHFSIGTPSPLKAPTDCKLTVSENYFTVLPDYFSPFPHGTRSLSVTWIYLDLPNGLGRFTRNSSSIVLLGNNPKRQRAFTYGAITLSSQAFNPVQLTRHFITPRQPVRTSTNHPTTPTTQPLTSITRSRFGLLRFRSPLLTEYLFL